MERLWEEKGEEQTCTSLAALDENQVPTPSTTTKTEIPDKFRN
jgi:hypothetical protein